MARGINKVILIGNLGRDPEARSTQGGKTVANFSIACSESWVDQKGEKHDRTEWVNIVAWGKLGELCGQYLRKGSQVYIEGKLQTREWADKEGQKRYTTEVNAQDIQFLGGNAGEGRGSGSGGRQGGGSRSGGGGAQRGGGKPASGPEDGVPPDDDTPF